jgi:hypothetical protein
MILKTDTAALRKELSELTTAYYETAKWMLVHNQKPAGE